MGGDEQKSDAMASLGSSSSSFRGSVHEHKRNVGVISAIFLIVNRLIGTGIFSTPSSIFSQSGSPGLALILWAIGTLISISGLMCYLEFGSMLPENGGESVYIAKAFPKPKYLVSSTYCIYVFLLGWAASNSIAFGQYILAAADYFSVERTEWQQQWVQPLVGFACLTFAFLIQAFFPRPALYLSNILGLFKVVVLIMIIIIGWVGWGGGGGIKQTHNFHNSFDKGLNATGYGVVSSLLNVIWSFIGYSNANYALGEARNPQRVLKIAAPIGLVLVAILYMLANISYLGVVPWEAPEGQPSIISSGNILAADFFGIVWGERGRKALSVFVALSALGNVIVVIYGVSHLVQQLGRQAVMPFSRILGSSRPLGTPLAGLFEHYCFSIILLFAPAAAGADARSDSYNFVANLITYPLSVVNGFVGLGIIWVNFRKRERTLKLGRWTKVLPALFPEWHPYIKATWPVAFFFVLGNLYLIVAPFVPPEKASENQYKTMPYWIHACVGLCLYGAGLVYWLVVFKLTPWIFGYTVETEEYTDTDGWKRERVVHIDKKGNKIHEPTSLDRNLDSLVNNRSSKAERWTNWVDEKTTIPELRVPSSLKFWSKD